MKTRMTTLGAAFATASMLGSLAVPNVAHAGSEGRKNTAIGLGAAAVHQMLNGKTTNGVLLGAGAAYAYKKYQDSRQDDKRQQRSAQYRNNGSRNSGSRSRYGAADRNAYGGAFVYTGRVDADTEQVKRRITVDHNGIVRHTDIPKSAQIVHAGNRISAHELRSGDLVRVTAVQTDENRFRARKIEVLNAAIDTNARTPYSRERVGAADRVHTPARPKTARYNGSGVVESVSEDGSSFTVRVGTNLRRVFVENSAFDGINGAGQLREGDRVRVLGTMDGSDVVASEVVLLD